MPNYTLTSGSTFKPFTFDELLKPALMATQYHRELEDAYSTLDMAAEEWGNKLNAQTDSKSYAKYQAFTQALEKQAEDLAKHGLNPSSRQNMLKMRSRYAADINPIAEAWKRREEQIAEQRKAGNAMIPEYDARTKSIDEYVGNPALSYEYIDRKDLYTRAVNDFGQYAKALSDYGNGKKLDGFTKTFIQNTGITPEQARNFTNEIRNGNIDMADPTLAAVYQALYNSIGVDRWNNPDAQRAVQETILEGAGAAIGKSTVSTYEDKAAYLEAQNRYSKELEIWKASMKKKDEDSNFLMPRVDGGVDTSNPELLEITKRTKGLRRTENSFTTDTLQDKFVALRKAEEEFKSFMEGKSYKDYETAKRDLERRRGVAKKSGSGEVMAALQTSGAVLPADYGRFESLKKKVDEARNSYNEEQKYLRSLRDRYSHLGGSSYDNIKVGIELEKSQRKQDNSSYALNLKNSSYKDILLGLSRVLGTASEAEYSGVGLRKIGKSNNISRDAMIKILSDDNTSIRVRGGDKGGLQVVDKEGTVYTIEGISNITKANSELATTTNYLRSFDKESVKGARSISDKEYIDLIQNGRIPQLSNSDLTRIGGSYTGVVLHNKNSNDYIKVMLDNSGNVLAINNLGSELAGGQNRDAYFTSMASSTLRNLTNLLATKAE